MHIRTQVLCGRTIRGTGTPDGNMRPPLTGASYSLEIFNTYTAMNSSITAFTSIVNVVILHCNTAQSYDTLYI